MTLIHPPDLLNCNQNDNFDLNLINNKLKYTEIEEYTSITNIIYTYYRLVPEKICKKAEF